MSSATLKRCKDRDEWLVARANGIGASDAAGILGLSPWSSPLNVWASKLGLDEPTPENARMKWGNKLEPVVAEAYAEETGAEVIDHGRWTIAIHAEIPYMMCTLDREVRVAGRAEPGVLEVKTAGAEQARKWADEVPEIYWVQIQHQMAVTGATWGVLVVLIGGSDFRHFEVERDEVFIADLFIACAKFWELVKAQQQPTDVGPGDAKIISQLYPTHSKEGVPLPGEANEWDIQLEAAKVTLGEVEDRVDTLKNRFKLAIGKAEFGTCPDGTIYTHKSQGKKGSIKVDPKYATRLAESSIPFTETKPSTHRVLRRKGSK